MTQELTTTRANHLVDPALTIWGSEVACYLFLGGLVAGLMILTGLWSLRATAGERSRHLTLLPWAAPLLLSLGMLFLWLDLENRWNVFRFYLAIRPASPMSWGAWILLAIYPVALVHAWLATPPDLQDVALRRLPLKRLAARIATCPLAAPRLVARANVALGAALGIYTGILLGTLSARPLWSSAVLGPLFLTSGLSTGAAFLLLWRLSNRERAWLGKADMALIVIELALIGLWLGGLLTGGRAAREAASLVLGGPFTASFWSLVVAAGLVMPLLAEWLEWRHRVVPGRFAALLVLGGGLALRWILVNAGQVSGWAAGLAAR